eukprot:gene17382-20684_t
MKQRAPSELNSSLAAKPKKLDETSRSVERVPKKSSQPRLDQKTPKAKPATSSAEGTHMLEKALRPAKSTVDPTVAPAAERLAAPTEVGKASAVLDMDVSKPAVAPKPSLYQPQGERTLKVAPAGTKYPAPKRAEPGPVCDDKMMADVDAPMPATEQRLGSFGAGSITPNSTLEHARGLVEAAEGQPGAVPQGLGKAKTDSVALRGPSKETPAVGVKVLKRKEPARPAARGEDRASLESPPAYDPVAERQKVKQRLIEQQRGEHSMLTTPEAKDKEKDKDKGAGKAVFTVARKCTQDLITNLMGDTAARAAQLVPTKLHPSSAQEDSGVLPQRPLKFTRVAKGEAAASAVAVAPAPKMLGSFSAVREKYREDRPPARPTGGGAALTPSPRGKPPWDPRNPEHFCLLVHNLDKRMNSRQWQ